MACQPTASASRLASSGTPPPRRRYRQRLATEGFVPSFGSYESLVSTEGRHQRTAWERDRLTGIWRIARGE